MFIGQAHLSQYRLNGGLAVLMLDMTVYLYALPFPESTTGTRSH